MSSSGVDRNSPPLFPADSSRCLHSNTRPAQQTKTPGELRKPSSGTELRSQIQEVVEGAVAMVLLQRQAVCERLEALQAVNDGAEALELGLSPPWCLDRQSSGGDDVKQAIELVPERELDLSGDEDSAPPLDLSPPKQKRNAISFVRFVQSALVSRESVYKLFLKVLADYKSGRKSSRSTIMAMFHVFRGRRKALLEEFLRLIVPGINKVEWKPHFPNRLRARLSDRQVASIRTKQQPASAPPTIRLKHKTAAVVIPRNLAHSVDPTEGAIIATRSPTTPNGRASSDATSPSFDYNTRHRAVRRGPIAPTKSVRNKSPSNHNSGVEKEIKSLAGDDVSSPAPSTICSVEPTALPQTSTQVLQIEALLSEHRRTSSDPLPPQSEPRKDSYEASLKSNPGPPSRKRKHPLTIDAAQRETSSGNIKLTSSVAPIPPSNSIPSLQTSASPQPAMTAQALTSLRYIIRALQNHRHAWPFLEAQDAQETETAADCTSTTDPPNASHVKIDTIGGLGSDATLPAASSGSSAERTITLELIESRLLAGNYTSPFGFRSDFERMLALAREKAAVSNADDSSSGSPACSSDGSTADGAPSKKRALGMLAGDELLTVSAEKLHTYFMNEWTHFFPELLERGGRRRLGGSERASQESLAFNDSRGVGGGGGGGVGSAAAPVVSQSEGSVTSFSSSPRSVRSVGSPSAYGIRHRKKK